MVGQGASLEKVVEAQQAVWPEVLSELRAGSKVSHWMWFVFPQLASLGRSATAKYYGLRDLQEARGYLDHPLLGPRLVECCELLGNHASRRAVDIFGPVDAMKLRSCLTLFAQAAPEQPVFDACLRQFFRGEPDPLTVAELAS